MKYKIAVAGFQHETNTFSPAKTAYEEFLKADGWPGLTRGDAVLKTLPALNLPLGGFLQAAGNHTIVPTIWASAEPYGPVTKDAFEKISAMILDGLASCSDINAVYLDLHGAMVTEHTEDGEGELLRLIRDKIGTDLPLVISLDFHANITPDMVAYADAITVFRTYPHIDMAATGARAFQLLEQLLQRGEPFNKAYRQIPYLIPLSSQHTGSTPCNHLYDKLPTLISTTVANVDFACGFPSADIYHCGAALVAYGSSQQDVDNTADSYLNDILEAETAFSEQLLTAEEAVRTALQQNRAGAAPVIIADIQDNPGAGGSADTTGLLQALIAQKAQQAILGCLWDPEAAEKAHAAGCGVKLTLSLGGKNGPAGEAPWIGEVMVEALSNGEFHCHGEMLAGIEVKLGPMALLRVVAPDSEVRIAVTSERFQCIDQDLFRELGVEPATQAIVVVKSTVHFRADFEPIAANILLAASPGANPCHLEAIPYRRLRPGLRLGPGSLQISGREIKS